MSRKTLLMATVLIGALLSTMVGGTPAQGQQGGILGRVLQTGTIRIATIVGNPPYSSITSSGEPEGYDVDIGKMIAQSLQVKPQFIQTDHPGRIASLSSGKADITIADLTRNVDRARTIAFTDPYVLVGGQWLTLSKRGDLNVIADMNNPKVKTGVPRGGISAQWVPANAPKGTLVLFDNEVDAALALKSGQIDALALDNLYNADQIKKFPGVFKVISGPLLSREEIAIGLPMGDFDWWRVINLWVQQFNASGDNARLFKKWFGYEMPRIQAAY